MDDVRGTFGSSENTDHADNFNESELNAAHDGPPAAIGTDERRMQVRAYNHWAGLLGERNFPSIEELQPQDITDFGANSVLLDFSTGIDDPAVQFLGDKLAEECGADGPINKLSDVPARSLLSRITDHYMQILANEAPIGFEAEFVNRDGHSILYRGILLPYSSDDETIDFIYGVINWKEMADQATADALLLEIDQALESEPLEEDEAHKHPKDPVTAWSSSSLDDFDESSTFAPAQPDKDDTAESNDSEEDVFELELEQIEPIASDQEADDEERTEADAPFDDVERVSNTASLLDIRGCDAAYEHQLTDDLNLPDFAQYNLEDPEEEEFESGEDEAAYHFASLADYLETPTKKAIDLDADLNVPDGFDPDHYDDHQEAENTAYESQDQPVDNGVLELSSEGSVDAAPLAGEPAHFDIGNDGNSEDSADATGLYDCLAAARELAQDALSTEDRSRNALYEAVGRAYDFSIEAEKSPDEYAQLIAESGLSIQARAPMTPIVKLVFGSNYDKTRLTEYAAVLSHAHRKELATGSLVEFLKSSEGGLKGVVKAERRLRREESGKVVEPKTSPRAAIAKKLRNLKAQTLAELDANGPEFALVMVRRDGAGGVELLGEINDDIAMIERAAKKLIG